VHIIYHILLKEREENIPNGLYKATQIDFSYNSNRIEGSTITYVNTASIYEKHQLLADSNTLIQLDDIKETENHFALFNFMLDTIHEPLNERLIKEYQQLLKRNTQFEQRYGSGRYKSIPNIVSDVSTAQPYEVPEKMGSLIKWYSEQPKVINTILRFHCEFERIHPFQDGNGRVGRIIMFRECLLGDIQPFVIKEETKGKYYDGIHEYQINGNLNKLSEYIQTIQMAYLQKAQPFVEFYKTQSHADSSTISEPDREDDMER